MKLHRLLPKHLTKCRYDDIFSSTNSQGWQRTRQEFRSAPYTIKLEAKDRKIGHCFFKANQAKIANCVMASAVAQHIEAPIYANNTSQAKLCLLVFKRLINTFAQFTFFHRKFLEALSIFNN
jgi:hypothetical protein